MQSSHGVDVMTDLLERSRARGAGFSHSTVHGDFGLEFDGVPGLAVHAIVDGELHLETESGRTERLLGGDIVLVRGGLDHSLASEPGHPCITLPEYMDAARVSERRFALGTHGARAVFFCGAYLFEGDVCTQLLRMLPETIRLRPAAGSALRATLDLLAREIEYEAPGQQTLLDRLLDVALVQVLREHFATAEEAPPWFRASSDPQLGPALRAVHADPAHPWTVESLAARASLSRAAFARRFTAELGLAPLAYVTGWRMALAREQLRDSDDQIAAVASALGYASEFSFAAAFKRHHGVAPGRWRKGSSHVREERLALDHVVAEHS